MQTTRAYSFVSGDGGGKWKFSIEIAQRGSKEGTVRSLSAVAIGRGGAEIVFVLSADAKVDVAVLNITGRTISWLAVDRVVNTGCNRLYWNGLYDDGANVPPAAQ